MSDNAELLGWFGVVLSVLGGLWATADFWRTFGDVGLTAMLLLVTGGMGVAAVVIGRAAEVAQEGDEDQRAARRLSTALWVGSSLLAPVTVYLGLHRLAGLDADPALLAAGLVVAVMGGVAWTGRTPVYGHLATFGGVVLFAVGLTGVLGGGPDATAVALYLLALAWAGCCAAERLAPAAIGYAAAGVTAIGCAQAMVFAGHTGVGIVLGLIVAVAATVVAVLRRTGLAISLASLAAVLFVPQAIARWLHDMLSLPTLLLVGGAAMVTASVVLIRRATARRVPGPSITRP